MKKLGMIGGTSWYSTMEYYKLINEAAASIMGKASNPELLIHSINIDVMRRQDKEEINAKYLEVAGKLQEAGAEAIIICANTPHMAYNYVQPKITIPILHIAQAIGLEAKKEGLKSLGLMGNKPTMTKGFIQQYLQEEFDIKTLIPDESFLDQAHYFVSQELTQGIFSEESKSFFINLMNHLASKGAEGMILGCTELPILFKDIDYKLPLIPTTQLHVKLAVDFIMER